MDAQSISIKVIGIQAVNVDSPVLRIHDILVWIRIPGSMQ
jgi:hypothetical protein